MANCCRGTHSPAPCLRLRQSADNGQHNPAIDTRYCIRLVLRFCRTVKANPAEIPHGINQDPRSTDAQLEHCAGFVWPWSPACPYQANRPFTFDTIFAERQCSCVDSLLAYCLLPIPAVRRSCPATSHSSLRLKTAKCLHSVPRQSMQPVGCPSSYQPSGADSCAAVCAWSHNFHI